MKTTALKKSILALSVIVFFSFIAESCVSTPITDVGSASSISVHGEPFEDEPNMEFIGFKPEMTLLAVTSQISKNESYLADLLGGSSESTLEYFSDYNYWMKVRDTKTFRRFGSTLSKLKMADDCSKLYFGEFTPQDLVMYKSAKRYVAFVSVQETQFLYHDTAKTQQAWTNAGFILSIGGAAFIASMIDDFPPGTLGKKVEMALSAGSFGVGLLCFIPQFFTPKTKFAFKGKYAICVYDTKEKCLVAKEPIEVEWMEEWNGSIESDKTDQKMINNFCALKLENALIDGFRKVSGEYR